MQDSHITENEFLSRLSGIILNNISDERFGVSELAHEVGMSRSNLLRKVQKLAKVSASQFIRQVRLKEAMEILKQKEATVSEVSFQIGFSSSSYFIKCFREYYGYPPGEVGKRKPQELGHVEFKTDKKTSFKTQALAVLLFLVIAGLVYVIISLNQSKRSPEKSIAVLPFQNDSNDSSNVYITNGLMEAILNNLQTIGELRVISRTSVEKYRNKPTLVKDIAKELDVNYIIEGSGQKVGDKLLLTVQLIEASTDNHLWAEQYNRKVDDIFIIQSEVAKNIAHKVQAIITPDEEARINRIPTENLEAYDAYLKGLEFLKLESEEGLLAAMPLFEKAIEFDPIFAEAHAFIAISYYYLEIFQKDRKHTDEINKYSDKAILLEPKLPQCMIAKGLYYLSVGEYNSAEQFLLKALEYSPNSAETLNILSDFYANYSPNTEKYIEYALRGIKLDIASNDSSGVSYIYLHVSNAFIQTGFEDEALYYANKSLAYNPDNLYSEYVKAYIMYAKEGDLQATREALIETLKKDTNRLDIMQEIGKICYYQRDFETAYLYFKKFNKIRELYNLNIYPGMNATIGYVFEQAGQKEKAEELFASYKVFAENNTSIYKHLSLCAYHSYNGDTAKAIEHLRLFAEEKDYHYWTVIFLRQEPLIDNIIDLPECQQLLKDIELKFWKNHRRIKAELKLKNLI